MVAKIGESFGSIDILANNAGVSNFTANALMKERKSADEVARFMGSIGEVPTDR